MCGVTTAKKAKKAKKADVASTKLNSFLSFNLGFKNLKNPPFSSL
jgi:hypothetical protein